MGLSYKGEILSMIRTLFGRVAGEYIFPVGNLYTMVVNLEHDEVKLYSKEEEKIYDFTGEGIEAGIFDWVMDNRHNIPNTLQSKIIDEVSIPEPTSFISDPVEVKGMNIETGKMDLTIGVIGVVRDPAENGEVLRRVIFISPDGSWTTLTAYYEHLPDTEATAVADLGLIANELNKFKLPGR